MTRLASTAATLAVTLGAVLASTAPAAAQRRVIRPEGPPVARPYSPGVLAGQTLYISGQLGLPGTGPTPATMDVQARQAMDGIGGVLKAAGLGYQHLVKCHVYLANMDDYAAMNAAYGSYFTDRVPARTTVQAMALPAGAGVEIACIAYADVTRISVVRRRDRCRRRSVLIHPPSGPGTRSTSPAWADRIRRPRRWGSRSRRRSRRRSPTSRPR
jgi:2-iminobutanoate/2-iminopropanoate deaminase